MGGWAWPTPDTSAANPVPLPAGMPLEILQRWGDWILIRAPNGWQAWTGSVYVTPMPLPVPAGTEQAGATPAEGGQLATAPAAQPAAVAPPAAPSAPGLPVAPIAPVGSTGGVGASTGIGATTVALPGAHVVPVALAGLAAVGVLVVVGGVFGPVLWPTVFGEPTASHRVGTPGPSVDSFSGVSLPFDVELEYTHILGDFDSCRWQRNFVGRFELDVALDPSGAAYGAVRMSGSGGGGRVTESNLRSGQLAECPDQPLFDIELESQIVAQDREHFSALFTLEQGITVNFRGTRTQEGFAIEADFVGGSGPTNRTTARFRAIWATAPPTTTPGVAQSPTNGGDAGTFIGEFDASGQFRAGACTWSVTLSGTVSADLAFTSGQVTGEAQVRAHAVTERQSGGPTCSGAEEDWNDRVAVSGSAGDVTFSVRADPYQAAFQGVYDPAAQVIRGTIDVSSTLAEVDGSVRGDLVLIGQ